MPVSSPDLESLLFAAELGNFSPNIVEAYLTSGAATVTGLSVDIDGVLIHGAQGVRSLSILPIARAAGSPPIEGRRNASGFSATSSGSAGHQT